MFSFIFCCVSTCVLEKNFLDALSAFNKPWEYEKQKFDLLRERVTDNFHIN